MKHAIWIPIASCILAALSALAVVLWVPARRLSASGDPAGDVDWLRRELKLTPEQSRTVEKLARTYRAELNPCSRQHCAARCNLSGVLFQPGLPEADMDAAAVQLAKAQAAAERATLSYFRRVHAVLTPEQKPQFEKLVLNCVCKEHQSGECCCSSKNTPHPGPDRNQTAKAATEDRCKPQPWQRD